MTTADFDDDATPCGSGGGGNTAAPKGGGPAGSGKPKGVPTTVNRKPSKASTQPGGSHTAQEQARKRGKTAPARPSGRTARPKKK